jgi:hypothetical protein
MSADEGIQGLIFLVFMTFRLSAGEYLVLFELHRGRE